MIEERIEILIAKYFVNQINSDELQELKDWLKEGNNKEVYKEYIDANYAVESSKEKTYSEEEYEKLMSLLVEEKKKNKILTQVLKYAAVFVGLVLLAVGYTTYNNIMPKQEEVAKVEIPEEDVTLVLTDGTVETIDVNSEKKIINKEGDILGMQVGKEIVYNKKQEPKVLKKPVFNTLNVPYGKTFKITMNDGTQVHLNAGSSIKYPDFFAENTKREVFLKGEAYFVVSKDAKRPFVVNSSNVDVTVLGTQFNVSAYKNDEVTDVVLVEGSVAVKNVEKSIIIKPNQKASLSIQASDFKVTNVSVQKYISWKEGELFFHADLFSNILKKLERHFNVEVESKDVSLNKTRFTGRFNKESITEVLDVFKAHTNFSYKISGNKITIKK